MTRVNSDHMVSFECAAQIKRVCILPTPNRYSKYPLIRAAEHDTNHGIAASPPIDTKFTFG